MGKTTFKSVKSLTEKLNGWLKVRKNQKTLKCALISIASLLALILLVVSFALIFANSYLNSPSGNKFLNGILGNYLKAEIVYDSIELNLWNSMPNAELRLNNTKIFSKAISHDQTDTLMQLDTLDLSVNVVEFFKANGLIVNKIILSNLNFIAHKTKTGAANWDIFVRDTTQSDTNKTDIKLKITLLNINNINIEYTDDSTNATAVLDSANISLEGDIRENILNFTTKLQCRANYNKHNSKIQANLPSVIINLDADLATNKFELSTDIPQIATEFADSLSATKATIESTKILTLAEITDGGYNVNTNLCSQLTEYKDKQLSFSNIPITFALQGEANSDFTKFSIDTLDLECNELYVNAAGQAEHLADSSWNTDLTLNLNVARIEKVLGMIPQSLFAELKNYQVSGKLDFNGKVKGKYKGDKYPSVDAILSMSNVKTYVVKQDATVKLDLETAISYNSDTVQKSYINVSSLKASVGENYLDFEGNAKNILGDPQVDAKLNCKLNLDYISKLFPIDDVQYKGKLSSNFEARFALSNLVKANIPKLYVLGDINIERILLRVPSQRLFVFGKNATADLGINSIASRRTGKTHLSTAKLAVDTLKVKMSKAVDANISRLNLNANIDEPINDVPKMRVSGRLNGLQAIMNDTIFIAGKSGRLSLSVRPDTIDNLIPALRASLNLDSVTYYEPTAGSFLDSTRLVINGRPRVRKFKRVDGKRVEIDQSTRTSMNLDSLIRLCANVKDAETALKKFTFDGKMYAKTARYMTPYLNLRMAARRFDLTFTDDTVTLKNFGLRIGQSRLRLNGKVENLRRAFLRGRTLSADLKVTSRRLDLNEILYANYIGQKAKQKDNLAKSFAKQTIEKNKEKWLQKPSATSILPENDSLRAQVVDSLRRTYGKRDLSEIYNERMGKMREFLDKAYAEELTICDDSLECSVTQEISLDTVPMTLMCLPNNINANLALKLDTIIFAGLKMSDFNGAITTQNSTLSIKNLSTNSNVGGLKLNATYHCDTPEIAKAGIDLVGTNITVENLLKAFPMVNSILPMLSSFEGKLDCELSALTDLDYQIEPILPSLQTACHINGKDLVLLDGETFSTVAKFLTFNKKTKNVIDKMSVEFTIADNTLNVYPFAISMDKYKVAVSGNMDFDFKYFFHISVLEPKALPIPLGINVKTKEPKKKKKGKNTNEDEGELAEETNDFEFRLVKPLYKDENSIAQSINLANDSGIGRISLQQNLRKTIEEIIENFESEK